MSLRRCASAIGLLAILLSGTARADEAADLSAQLAAARLAHFHRLWPAAAISPDAPLPAIAGLLAADRPWEAALQAARLEADAGVSADAAALLAVAAARSGLLDTAVAALARAARADRRLLADAANDTAGALLAQGRPEASIAALSALPPRLDRETRNRAALIKARAQFQLDRPQAAAQTLQAAEYDPLQLIGAPPDERLRAGVLQYDLGLALIRTGNVDRGRALLERLGRQPVSDPGEQALRDRANLSLANDFLGSGQGATARAIYERVALEGPWSNLALLGMGWAALGPQGDDQAAGRNLDSAGTRSTPKFVLKALQRRRLIDCENYNRRALAPTELCRRLRPFDKADVPDRVETLAEEAIVVWQALSLREPRDPAVREAWSALGHAAARAGQRAEAIAHYESAVSRIEAAMAENRAAAERSDTESVAALGEPPFATGLPPGSALPAAARVRFETALGLDATPPSAAREQRLIEYAETRWLLAARPDDEALTLLSQAQQRALADTIRTSLDREHQQLMRWLGSARSALATLSDPSFVLLPDTPVH